MRYKQLLEGVKFGKREHDAILKDHHSSFYIGIEYECILPDNLLTGDLIQDGTDYVYNNQIRNIDKVEKEHDNMVEIITNVMPLLSGLKHIKNFFDVAKKNNVTFPDTAGLHISISRKGAFDHDINLVKFMVLLDANYIHGIFPTRMFVQNASSVMRNAMKEYVSNELGNDVSMVDIDQAERVIKKRLNDEDEDFSKYITAKISDYVTQGGRIELRFVGGKDYDKQFNSIVYQVVRACFLIGVAYDNQLYRKEYLKKLYTYIPSKDEMAVYDLFNNNKNYFTLSKKQKEMALEHAKESPKNAYLFTRFLDERVHELEPIILKSHAQAIHYALEHEIDTPEFRDKVLEHAKRGLTGLRASLVNKYVKYNMGERWPEYEEVVAQAGTSMIAKYVENVLKELHPEGIQIDVFDQAVYNSSQERLKKNPAANKKISRDRKIYIEYAYNSTEEFYEKIVGDD